MVHLRMQSIICLNYTRKSYLALTNVIEIANEKAYRTRLKAISEIDLRLHIDAKSDQLNK